jgi:peroxidase
MPILISQSDEFYSHFSQNCMNFVRSSLIPSRDCRFSYAKVPSKVTHFIDGSTIYGSDLKAQMQLRSFNGGLLKASVDFNRELLPIIPESDKCLNKGPMCFNAGDARVNQNIALVALHMIFAREHNRIARVLNFLNPHWNDEVIFQESRRIVIAELQHITYNEWLPLILGNSTMQKFFLNVKNEGFSIDYDDDVNPSMTHEFTGAAFRFGHSAIQGKYM